jgi:hypothetical protein
MALPLPAAFKELVSMYRGFAKQVRGAGDSVNSAEWYRRMYSLAKLNAVGVCITEECGPIARLLVTEAGDDPRGRAQSPGKAEKGRAYRGAV